MDQTERSHMWHHNDCVHVSHIPVQGDIHTGCRIKLLNKYGLQLEKNGIHDILWC